MIRGKNLLQYFSYKPGKLQTLSLTFFILFCFTDFLSAQHLPLHRNASTGKVTVVFKNKMNGVDLILNDRIYTNSFGESFTVKKLKYYISHFNLHTDIKKIQDDEVHLIDQSDTNSLSFSLNISENDYTSIDFLIGVDSTKNTSGAQTGALDPLNDMFWTWHTGYVMFKMEGQSPQSNAINNKIEYHIGGFSGKNSVLKKVSINLEPDKILHVKKGKISTIIIETDMGQLWSAVNEIKISETPVCATEGDLAQKIAANYARIFSVKSVTNAL